MKLLLDTHIFLALIGEGSVVIPSAFSAMLNERDTTIVVSTASL